MTTIAYRNGVMASDSRAFIDCIAPYAAKKLHRLDDGGVAAACGERQEIMSFIAWMNTDRAGRRPRLKSSTVVELQASKPGLIIHETDGSYEQECEFMAWGSGAEGALGAMHMGADAAKAIEIAALLDTGTGGAIVTMMAEHANG